MTPEYERPVRPFTRSVAREWFDNQRAGWTETYAEKVIHSLEIDAFPKIGSRPISSIEAPEMLEIIRASGQLNASVEGFQLVNAAGVAVRVVPPIAQAISDACNNAAGSDREADCIAIAKKMAASGSMGAKDAGLKAVHIPVSGGIGEGQLIRMEAALKELPKPVFGYCRSGARAGSLYSSAKRAMA